LLTPQALCNYSALIKHGVLREPDGVVNTIDRVG
jgi:hypothetical protein